MPELLSPGVIIQEVPFGPQPIQGVSTSTAGFVGETLFGPSEGPPVLVTSFPDFVKKFGGHVSGKMLAYAMQGFFENGGRRAYVARVVASGATRGSAIVARTTAGTLVPLRGPVTATGVANEYVIPLASVVGLGHGASALTLIDRRGTAPDVAFAVTSVDALTGLVKGTATVTGSEPAIAGRAGDRYFVRVGAAPAASEAVASVLPLEARDKGSFSARLSVLALATLGNSTPVRALAGTNVYELADVSFISVGDRLQFATAAGRAVGAVSRVNLASRQVTISPALGFDPVGGTAHVVRWRFDVAFDGTRVETLDITTDPSRIRAEIEASSSWIRIPAAGTLTLDPSAATGFATFPSASPVALSPGSDGTGTMDGPVVGSSVAPRSGIAALEPQDGINLVAAPGYTGQTVVNALITQAELLKDRFAVFEAPKAADDTGDVLAERGLYNSQYAAMYYPWLSVRDPLTGASIEVPPSGHVLGAYARTDNDRGVFKAPANVVLRGILGFAREVSTGEQDVLNPLGVNVLRRFDGLGLVIWGARTVSADTLWKYVPVRRLFIFLEQSIARGTRYAVFEPNAQPLWRRIHDSLTNFLTTQWRAGALFGDTPDQAFFVRVDETTTTQDDRDNGIVNIVVGVAPVKPAEFVVFHIGQAPSSVIVAEQG